MGFFQLQVTAILYVAKALYTANGVQVVDFSTLSHRPYMMLATIALAVGAGVDIMIAIFMTFLFLRKRIDAGFASTAYILQRLQRICSEYRYLAGRSVSLDHHLAACLFVEYALCRALYAPLLSLLQHPSCQSECKRVSWGSGDTQVRYGFVFIVQYAGVRKQFAWRSCVRLLRTTGRVEDHGDGHIF
ncbi:hypothetical protein JVU11DRAFT_6659 [Chiua virens]|nr:hypothetical protein JVU11DRAFT_6659 [Chiua virens]